MLIKIYSDNPSPREVQRVADSLQNGGIAVVPTDTLYAFVCSTAHKRAVESIARLKGFSLRQARYSLVCHSISQLSDFSRPISRHLFALLKQALPGPFTFIMDANNDVPRHLLNANRTIGFRVPDNNICRAIVEAVGTPLVATSVRRVDNPQDEVEYITDPELIHDTFSHLVDIVVDGGMGSTDPSTVVDCTADEPVILRQGKGTLDI